MQCSCNVFGHLSCCKTEAIENEAPLYLSIKKNYGVCTESSWVTAALVPMQPLQVTLSKKYSAIYIASVYENVITCMGRE